MPMIDNEAGRPRDLDGPVWSCKAHYLEFRHDGSQCTGVKDHRVRYISDLETFALFNAL